MRAPFPWFGGKSKIAKTVWQYFGNDCVQYIEPFCGSAAVLLANPAPCSLEVVNDVNCFLANFWRATKHQPAEVAKHADYPVSHIDLGARHDWLLEQSSRLASELQDPHWAGDALVAGWWLWGQCCWIGSGWCEPGRIPQIGNAGRDIQAKGQIPHISDTGRGIQAKGKIPHISDAGMGIQAKGQIPHISDAGMGIQAKGKIPQIGNAEMGSSGHVAVRMLSELHIRLDRVRILCGDWSRCLNNDYGKKRTAVFLDPPYLGTEGIYGAGADASVASQVMKWAQENGEDMRIVLCGHTGDNNLPGWRIHRWKRVGPTYGGSSTKDEECLWVSPACKEPSKQLDMFGGAE